MSENGNLSNGGKGICFVVMPIGEHENREDRHFKKIYDQIFVPAIKEAGFKPRRADDDCSSHLIQAEIIKKLIEAPMVLCDLSARNPNVLYELGIRHAFDKPVVLVQEINTERIFDISGINTVDYRPDRLFDEVLEDREKITEAIRETGKEGSDKHSLIKLIKVAAATYDSVNVTGEDKTEIMFGSIMKELQEMRRQNNIYRNNVYRNTLFNDTSKNKDRALYSVQYDDFNQVRDISNGIMENDLKIARLGRVV